MSRRERVKMNAHTWTRTFKDLRGWETLLMERLFKEIGVKL